MDGISIFPYSFLSCARSSEWNCWTLFLLSMDVSVTLYIFQRTRGSLKKEKKEMDEKFQSVR